MSQWWTSRFICCYRWLHYLTMLSKLISMYHVSIHQQNYWTYRPVYFFRLEYKLRESHFWHLMLYQIIFPSFHPLFLKLSGIIIIVIQTRFYSRYEIVSSSSSSKKNIVFRVSWASHPPLWSYFLNFFFSIRDSLFFIDWKYRIFCGVW